MAINLYLILALSLIVILIFSIAIALLVVCIRRRRKYASTMAATKSSDDFMEKTVDSAELQYFLGNNVSKVSINKTVDNSPITMKRRLSYAGSTSVVNGNSQSFVEPSDDVFNPPRFASLRHSNSRRASYEGNTMQQYGRPVQTISDRRLSLDGTPNVSYTMTARKQIGIKRRSSFGGSGIAPLLHTVGKTCLNTRRSSLGITSEGRVSLEGRNSRRMTSLESTSRRSASLGGRYSGIASGRRASLEGRNSGRMTSLGSTSGRRSSIESTLGRRESFNSKNVCVPKTTPRSTFSYINEINSIHNPNTTMLSRQTSMMQSTRRQANSSSIFSNSSNAPSVHYYSNNITTPTVGAQQGHTTLQRRSSYGHTPHMLF